VRTYISPIGYDTRRVTRPVVNTGLGSDDRVILLRPAADADTERATQAVADVEQLLQEIEPEATCTIERISTTRFEETVRECCRVIEAIAPDREILVSLGGGARDILLPLTVSALVCAPRIDTTLFFSDLDSTVREWSLPTLVTQVPERTLETFGSILDADGWQTLTELASDTDQSKSTVIRHVNDLDAAGIVETDTSGKAKRVRENFSGELYWMARNLAE
jgi:CRISPR-associated protein Csa3